MERTCARPPAIPIAAPESTLPASLPDVLDAVWDAIAGGIESRWTPWGLPALVSIGPDGEPHARVIAIRGCDPAARRFLFHSDARSDKVRALAADPRAAVLFWDPYDAVEVRFTGRAVVHCGDAVARDAWSNASHLSRSAAAVELAPGAPLPGAVPFDRLPAAADDETAFARFAVIAFEADSVDWLWLGPRDLRRARFAWTGSEWSGCWAVP